MSDQVLPAAGRLPVLIQHAACLHRPHRLGGQAQYIAQQLLQSTAFTVEAIAQQAGFGSALSLRQHFRRRFGVLPSDWRRSFAG